MSIVKKKKKKKSFPVSLKTQYLHCKYWWVSINLYTYIYILLGHNKVFVSTI